MAAKRSTTLILKNLRAVMKDTKYVTEKLNAYIIPSGDAHQSEYIAECDKRRQFVSGFTGSAGLACVTDNAAALWTDGRYFLQAERELDENWTLMKDGLAETPSLVDWLAKTVPRGGRVGVDPYLITSAQYNEWTKTLEKSNIVLLASSQNLVDVVWGAERPKAPSGHIFPLELSFAGKAWQDKVNDFRRQLKDQKIAFLTISALDEVAWTFNLRGSDIPYCPVFFAYAIIGTDFINLFVDESKVTPAVRDHLKSMNGHKVDILPYNSIGDALAEYDKKYTNGKIWMCPTGTSLALTDCVSRDRLYEKTSPVVYAKAVKNAVEMKGMQNCHIKDAVAHCEFLYWLEQEIQKRELNENDVAKKFTELRRAQNDYVSLSFETISAVGPNSAKPHYKPPEPHEPQTLLRKDQIYLVDSGGQYRDGTTDVTRTIVFSEPSAYQKECFTRVLKGHIALAMLKFPDGTSGFRLDAVARMALWDVGLEYRHGTGHGVGHFLNVHEGPAGFAIRPGRYNEGIAENMVITIEPGYYEDDTFGIRIENCYAIVKAETKHSFQSMKFLTSQTLTLVPIQLRLIDPTLMTAKEVEWLNNYHALIYETLAPIFNQTGRTDLIKWLREQTRALG